MTSLVSLSQEGPPLLFPLHLIRTQFPQRVTQPRDLFPFSSQQFVLFLLEHIVLLLHHDLLLPLLQTLFLGHFLHGTLLLPVQLLQYLALLLHPTHLLFLLFLLFHDTLHALFLGEHLLQESLDLLLPVSVALLPLLAQSLLFPPQPFHSHQFPLHSLLLHHPHDVMQVDLDVLLQHTMSVYP